MEKWKCLSINAMNILAGLVFRGYTFTFWISNKILGCFFSNTFAIRSTLVDGETAFNGNGCREKNSVAYNLPFVPYYDTSFSIITFSLKYLIPAFSFILGKNNKITDTIL